MFYRLMLMITLLCLACSPATAKRVALVVGNNSYANLAANYQLEKAVNDATAMRDTLQGLGFEVIFLQDAALRDFKNAVFKFSAKIEKGDVAAFYYSGHGAALKGTNYFLPSDITPVDTSHQLNEAEIEAQVSQLAEFSVKEALILEHMAKREPQVSLVIVDACRNNPLRDDKVENAFRSMSVNGVVLGDNISTAEKTLPEGMIIVYSAGFGQQALDRLNTNDKDPNSPFTRVLLKQLKQPGLGLGDVVKNTKQEVFRLAKTVAHKQTPSVYDQLFGGDVFLNGEPEQAKLPDTKPDTTPDPAQAAFVAAGENLSMLKVVAVRFSGTVWADFANTKIQELEKKVAVLVPEKPVAPECAGVSTTVKGKIRCLKPGDVFTDCKGCPEMVVVPAGSFMMGSPADENYRDSDEGPQHKVTFAKSFAIGMFEVTRGQFAEFAGDMNFDTSSNCETWSVTDAHPVVCVSWDDAQAYVQWLSKKSGVDYRLLTEAEWEYAARTGTPTTVPTETVKKSAVLTKSLKALAGSASVEVHDKHRLPTMVVGSDDATNFGLFDLAGNVEEWTEDCYEYNYKNAHANGNATEGRGCKRTIRGGGEFLFRFRWANRDASSADSQFNDLGFRIARDL